MDSKKQVVQKMLSNPVSYGASEEALSQLDALARETREVMMSSDGSQVTALWRQIDLSVVYHDCALEGQVVTPEELATALQHPVITDVASLSLYHALRQHQAAIDLARDVASRKNVEFDYDLVRELHILLSSDPEEAAAARLRRDIPLHRTYFHEICEPDKIVVNLKKLFSWLNDPEEEIELHPIQRACKFHARFMKIFPFTETSGKIGRTIMNILLMRYGYLPAIIHATERQRYYEAIRHGNDDLTELVIESANASLEAAIKFLRRSAVAS